MKKYINYIIKKIVMNIIVLIFIGTFIFRIFVYFLGFNKSRIIRNFTAEKPSTEVFSVYLI